VILQTVCSCSKEIVSGYEVLASENVAKSVPGDRGIFAECEDSNGQVLDINF